MLQLYDMDILNAIGKLEHLILEVDNDLMALVSKLPEAVLKPYKFEVSPPRGANYYIGFIAEGVTYSCTFPILGGGR